MDPDPNILDRLKATQGNVRAQAAVMADFLLSARPEHRAALAVALSELETSGLVVGRARAWVLLALARNRDSRGETAQLGESATQILQLSRDAHDRRAEADAQCLLGAVMEAQGTLEAAQAAFAEYLAISRRLADQDPSNAGWQSDLAVACWWVGDIHLRAGRAEAALALYEQASRIFGDLVEHSPGFAQWAKDKEAVEADLAQCRRSIEQSTPPDAEPPEDLHRTSPVGWMPAGRSTNAASVLISMWLWRNRFAFHPTPAQVIGRKKNRSFSVVSAPLPLHGIPRLARRTLRRASCACAPPSPARPGNPSTWPPG